MKRAVSLSVILLANVMMLVHGVIPHHHHQDVVHIAIRHGHDDRIPDRHPDNMHEYGLLTIFKTRSGPNKQLGQSIDINLGMDFSPAFFTLFSDDAIPPIMDNVGLRLGYNAFILLSYAGIISHSKGLRAPPVCWFLHWFSINLFVVHVICVLQYLVFCFQIKN